MHCPTGAPLLEVLLPGGDVIWARRGGDGRVLSVVKKWRSRVAGWNSTVSMAPLMASGMTSIAIEAAASPLISPASALLAMEVIPDAMSGAIETVGSQPATRDRHFFTRLSTRPSPPRRAHPPRPSAQR